MEEDALLSGLAGVGTTMLSNATGGGPQPNSGGLGARDLFPQVFQSLAQGALSGEQPLGPRNPNMSPERQRMLMGLRGQGAMPGAGAIGPTNPGAQAGAQPGSFVPPHIGPRS